MSYLFDATGEKGLGQFDNTYGYPLTLACWVKKSGWTTSNDYFLQLGNDNTTPNDAFQVRNAGDAESIAASSRDSGGVVNSAIDSFASAGDYDNIWLPCVAVFTGASSRTIYHDNITYTLEDTNTRTVTESVEYIVVGNGGAGNTPAEGYVAECAIWNKALSVAEITGFLQGNIPSSIASDNLMGYWPLRISKSTQANVGKDSGGNLTITSATYSSDHPTIVSDIEYKGTASAASNSESATSIDLTHTVAEGTELLLVAAACRAFDVSSVEDWVTTTEPFVPILEGKGSTSANDVDYFIYGIVNPTAKTETITFNFSASNTWQIALALNFAGNNTNSVAEAVRVLETIEPATFSTTTVFSSAGSANNALVALAGHVDAAADPSSINSSFIEVLDGDTGGGGSGNADAAYHASYLLYGVPAGPTITWSDNDWQRGTLLEIISGVPNIETVSEDNIIGINDLMWEIKGSGFGDN